MSAPKCYCGEPLRPDGTCRYFCPPEANPKLLRALDVAVRKRQREAASTGRGTLLTAREMQQAADVIPEPQATAWHRYWARNGRAARRRHRQ
jgi:hypothetical protein